MNKNIILLIFVIIVGVFIAVMIADSNDVGDFSLVYSGNSKKYKSVIEQGVNRWYSIGTGGINIRFTTYRNPDSTTIAYNTGRSIYINEPVFIQYSNYIKVLVIAHEVGHALGIGKWSLSQPLHGGASYLSNATFPRTGKAYVDNVRPAGQTIPGPPLASAGTLGEGSDLVHWSPSTLYGMQRDIMVPSISSSTNIISIVDLTYLSEINMKVDLTKYQKLNTSYYGAIMEFVYGKEDCEHNCGSCNGNKDCDTEDESLD